MPAKSQQQQKFMGLVHAYKKGEVPASKVSSAIKQAAKSMSKKSVKKYAKTKHDDLPKKVTEEKIKAENLVIKNLKNTVVIRPSVILGNNDQFLSNLLPIFKMSFFIPLFGDGSKKFQPVLIDDVVEFVSKTIEDSNKDKQLFELAGPDIFTYREFYNLIADAMNKKRVLVPIPMPIMKPVVGLGEKLPFFPINSEQLSLFETDNTLSGKESGFEYHKISPKRVISAVKKSL